MFRLWLMVPLLVGAMFWSGSLLGEDKKTAKEPILITKQLPAYYNKLGLSQKQKNEIYKVRGKIRTEIAELQQKINELRDQEKTDCENVLTQEQLARYRQIILGSDRRKNADAKGTAAKDKKKDAVARDKKKDAESKDKKDPVEIKK